VTLESGGLDALEHRAEVEISLARTQMQCI
jgi:hypothetical protein